ERRGGEGFHRADQSEVAAASFRHGRRGRPLGPLPRRRRDLRRRHRARRRRRLPRRGGGRARVVRKSRPRSPTMKNEKKLPSTPASHPVVSRNEWLQARLRLLEHEKELTRQHDEVARQRRELPSVRIGREYRFEGPNGVETLGDLFRGRSQLLVYHFMFGPEWSEGCPSCSFVSDHFDGQLVHLEHRDVSFTAVSHAPWSKIERFKKRMGWRFPWVSSSGGDFNFDFHVSATDEEKRTGRQHYNFQDAGFTLEEREGISVFHRDASGAIFHTYSSYERGVEQLMGTYHSLDLVPKGRDEDRLAFKMAWVRHHDRYGPDYAVDGKQGYV